MLTPCQHGPFSRACIFSKVPQKPAIMFEVKCPPKLFLTQHIVGLRSQIHRRVLLFLMNWKLL